MSIELTDCGELAKALAAAQAEMGNPSFDSQNPHFRSRFASLASVRNAVIPTLAKHGIACVQDIQTTERGVACYTLLMHSSGQSKTFGPLVMPASKPDAQGFGSAATYARRYSLQAVANVVGDDDDDANAASGKPAGPVAVANKHSPLGDVAPDDNAVKYADAMRDAIAASDHEAAYQVHLDVHAEGEEFYRNVWSLLDSKTRSAAKRIIEQRKAA